MTTRREEAEGRAATRGLGRCPGPEWDAHPEWVPVVRRIIDAAEEVGHELSIALVQWQGREAVEVLPGNNVCPAEFMTAPIDAGPNLFVLSLFGDGRSARHVRVCTVVPVLKVLVGTTVRVQDVGGAVVVGLNVARSLDGVLRAGSPQAQPGPQA